MVGFAGEATKPLGKIELEVCFESEGLCRRTTMKFTVIRAPSTYNVILGRTGLRDSRAIPSTIHSMIKFPTPKGIATLVTRSVIISGCRQLEKKQVVEEKKKEEVETRTVNVTEEVLVNLAFPDQLVVIGGGLPETCKAQLKLLLKNNMYIFAWEHVDMIGVPWRIIEHNLNVNASIEPERQKRRVLAPEKSKAVAKDVDEWVRAGIVRPIGRNLEAYVDDMVIKSNDEKILLANMAETFDNLRKINMKLNPKKCSFGVEEGKFLGYMVTSEGIHANPKKTRVLADLQSPRTLKEMQSLAGKLATLNRMLRRYFEAHSVKVIIDQPIKLILSKTEASGKLEKYVVELGAYNITFEPRNTIKGQVLADFITETPDGESPDRYFRTPEPAPEKDDTEGWTLFTDEASSSKGSGAGLVLIGPSGIEHTYALRLTFDNTNNEAEYEALLAGLRITRGMSIQKLETKVDSKLVASQINGSYVASSDSMMKYLAKAKEHITYFRSFSIKNIPRNQNQNADVLSKLTLVAFNHLTKEVLVEVLNERSTNGKEISTVMEEEGDN
ncbi:reverse transcriptase domain-containing protein [Tanacetum coccineum]